MIERLEIQPKPAVVSNLAMCPPLVSKVRFRSAGVWAFTPPHLVLTPVCLRHYGYAPFAFEEPAMPQTNRLQLKVCFWILAVASSSVCFAQGEIQLRLDPKSSSGSSPISQIEERTYDLSQAIAAYANDSKLPADEARDEALLRLFAPIGNDPSPIRRERIGPGKFKVWATPSFHALLPGVVEWMKNGQKKICIEARIVSVTEDTREAIHDRFSGQWEMSVFRESDAAFVQGTLPAAVATRSTKHHRTTPFVSSRSSTVMSLPSRMVQLTAEQAKTVVAAQQADTRSNVLQAPKVTVFPGQEATIKDTAQRPFVTGVKPVKGDMATAMQPVVEVLEEGLMISLSASLHGENRLDINSVIVSRRVGDVDTFTFKFDESCEETTVQVPEQHVNQVHVSKVVDDGATLLVDPHFVKEETVNKSWGRSATIRRYTMLMFTPRVIHQKPKHVVSQASAASVDGPEECGGGQDSESAGLVLGGVRPRIIIQEDKEDQIVLGVH